MKELGVELVEQPLAKDNWEGMKVLYQDIACPYMLMNPVCMKRMWKNARIIFMVSISNYQMRRYHACIKNDRKSKRIGLKVMVGCMNESTIGSAAIAHLLPLIDEVDMDGPLLLGEDLATGITYDYGKIQTTDEYGLGIKYTGPFKKHSWH